MATLQRQIVIQIGEEQNGMVIVRNGDNKQGSCPTQYLQEVWNGYILYQISYKNQSI